MSINSRLKHAIDQYGEAVVHSSSEQDFDTVGMITPLTSKTQFANDAVSFRSGFPRSGYYSYIAPLAEGEAYAIGDRLFAGEKQYTVSYCRTYPFKGENLYVHAFIKETGKEEDDGQP